MSKGVNVQVSIKDLISPELRSGLKLVKDKRKLLNNMAGVMEEMSRDSFRNESVRPKEWEELAASTLAAKKGRGGLLIDSSDLVHSFETVLGSNQAEVGTNVFYAPFHQTGTKKMPARPFMPLDESNQLTEEAQAEMKDILERTVKKAMGVL